MNTRNISLSCLGLIIGGISIVQDIGQARMIPSIECMVSANLEEYNYATQSKSQVSAILDEVTLSFPEGTNQALARYKTDPTGDSIDQYLGISAEVGLVGTMQEATAFVTLRQITHGLGPSKMIAAVQPAKGFELTVPGLGLARVTENTKLTLQSISVACGGEGQAPFPDHPTANTATIRVMNGMFMPATFTATVGKKIKVTLISEDGAHGLHIPELGFKLEVGPKGTKSADLVPHHEGVFEFVDTVSPNTKGKLTVKR